MANTAYGVTGESLSESPASTVPWGAIIAGAFAAAALSLILILFGSGFGLAAVAPWPRSGASAAAIGVGAAIWLVVVQWLSAALGGYLAGRLRPRSVGVHADEAHFRDTASGLIVWAVATVLGAALVASTASMITGHAARGVTAIASGAVEGASQGAASHMGGGADPTGYFVDSLFRTDANGNGSAQDARAEAGRILVHSLQTGDIPGPDKAQLARLVANQTGLSQADAQKRVDDVIAQAKDAEAKVKQAADAAAKAGATLAIIAAISLLIGAFIGAVAGALGGHHRDRWSERLGR